MSGMELVPAGQNGLRIADESQAWALLATLKANRSRAPTVQELKGRSDLLASAQELCRRRQYSFACQNAFAEQRIREEREIGMALEILAPVGRPGKRLGGSTFSDEAERTTIAKLGITKELSTRCRQLAAILEEDLGAYFAAANQREDDISIPDLLRKAYVARSLGSAATPEERRDVYEAPPEEGSKDRFQTPCWAVLPLRPLVGLGDVLIEPAQGEGNLVAEFRSWGRHALGFDILTGADFLAWNPRRGRSPARRGRRILATNPPGSKKTQFIAHADRLLEAGLIDAWAFLMPEDAFGGKERQAIYLRRGLEVILMGGRIPFKTPTGREAELSNPHEEYAWFTCGLNLPSQLCLWNRAEQRLLPIPCRLIFPQETLA